MECEHIVQTAQTENSYATLSRTEQTIEVVRGIEDTSNGISSASNLGSGVVGSGVVGSEVVGSGVVGSGVFGSGVFGSGVFGSGVFGSAVVGLVAPRAEMSMLHAASGL